MMVEQMGMSDLIGPRNVQAPQGSMYGEGGGGSVQGSIIKEKVDKEIDRILDEQYTRGMQLLTDNRDLLDAVAKTLIEEEKIDGKQLLTLIKNMKPELVTDKAMKAIESVVTPTGNDSPVP